MKGKREVWYFGLILPGDKDGWHKTNLPVDTAEKFIASLNGLVSVRREKYGACDWFYYVEKTGRLQCIRFGEILN